MEKKFKLRPPIMPNFLSIESGPRLRQEGFAHNMTIPVSELSKEEAIEYAELMKQEFIKHWHNKTKSQ